MILFPDDDEKGDAVDAAMTSAGFTRSDEQRAVWPLRDAQKAALTDCGQEPV